MNQTAAPQAGEPPTIVGSPVSPSVPPVRTPAEIIADAKAAGNREGLRDDQFRLDDDSIVTFKKLKLWDSVQIATEAGSPIEVLAKTDPLKFLGFAAWRCAVNGGFDQPFHDFAEKIPFDRVDELGAIVAPFMGKGRPGDRKSSG